MTDKGWLAGTAHVWALSALSGVDCANAGECAEYYPFDRPAESCGHWCAPCRAAYHRRLNEIEKHREAAKRRSVMPKP